MNWNGNVICIRNKILILCCTQCLRIWIFVSPRLKLIQVQQGYHVSWHSQTRSQQLVTLAVVNSLIIPSCQVFDHAYWRIFSPSQPHYFYYYYHRLSELWLSNCLHCYMVNREHTIIRFAILHHTMIRFLMLKVPAASESCSGKIAP